MTDAAEKVRPLLRTRQIRDFTNEALTDAELGALTEVARWTGSSRNQQPWRFLVIRDREVLRRIAEIGTPQTIPLRTAVAAIAILLPDDPKREIHDAYDEGRASERLLVAATMLDLGAGITWIRKQFRVEIGGLLVLPADWYVRTIVAVGHPSAAARRPKSKPGTARLPRTEVVFEERWPKG
jgi:nitroreductase